MHALRHVNERAARPDRGVQRGELVVAHRDDRGEVFLEQIRMLAQRGVGVQEDYALIRQVLADRVVDDFAFVLGGDAADEPLLLRLGDAQPVVGVLDVRGQVVPASSLLLGRPDEVLDVLEIDAGQVRAPGGHRLAPEQLQTLQPQVQHPLRLILQGRDVPDDLLGQAPARGFARHVRVGPAELVTLQPLKLGVRDCRHMGMPPDSVVVVSAAVLIVVLRMCTTHGAVGSTSSSPISQILPLILEIYYRFSAACVLETSRWRCCGRRGYPALGTGPSCDAVTNAFVIWPVILSGYRSGPRWLLALADCDAEMLGAFDAGIGKDPRGSCHRDGQLAP